MPNILELITLKFHTVHLILFILLQLIPNLLPVSCLPTIVFSQKKPTNKQNKAKQKPSLTTRSVIKLPE